MHHTLEDDLKVSGSLLQGVAPCGAVLSWVHERREIQEPPRSPAW